MNDPPLRHKYLFSSLSPSWWIGPSVYPTWRGLFVPTIVLGELYAGAYHGSASSSLLSKIAELLNDVQILDFDHRCAEVFGKVRGGLLRQGISVPTADLMIASVALVHDLILVTNNTADFRHVPGLRLENWLKL